MKIKLQLFQQLLLQIWAYLTRPELGLLISLASLLVAVFYRVEPPRREPVFLASQPTVALDAGEVSEAPVRLVRLHPGDLEPQSPEMITEDLTSLGIHFWNNGSSHIRREDLLEGPLRIRFPDKTTRIVYQAILKRSRTKTGIRLRPDPDPQQPHQLLLDFNFLGPDDGFWGKILFEGDPAARPVIEGEIAQVKEIIQHEVRPLKEPQQTLLWVSMASLFLWIVFGNLRAIRNRLPIAPYLAVGAICACMAVWIAMNLQRMMRPYSIPQAISVVDSIHPAPTAFRP